QQSEPVIVISPATAQASSSQPGAPIKRADSAEVMKMPDPIIEPITIMVASSGPRPRTKLVSALVGEAVDFPGTTPAFPTECSLSLMENVLEPRSPRFPFRVVREVCARTPPLLACRRARKSSRRALVHRFHLPNARLLPATSAERGSPLSLDHAARHHHASAEQASRLPDNYDRQKLRGRRKD